MRRHAANREGLARELACLPTLTTEVLKQRWLDLYGTAPPARLGRALMIRAVAHRLQENALGGLKPSVARQFARVAEDVGAGRAIAVQPATIKPGTRLLRQWQGSTHEVIILETGVRYQGKTWRSLSEVARAITGARWSGPLFFGLKERNHEGR